MTAKADLVNVTNLSTFGNWKDLTNDLRGVAQISVTMGDNEVNNGNVVLNGDLTLSASKTLKADIIAPTDNVNFLTLDKNLVRVKGVSAELEINASEDSGSNDTRGTLMFSKGDNFTDTLFVRTNTGHTELEIGSANKSFTINGSTGVITSSNGAKVSSSMIADALNGINIGQTTAGLGKFTKLECTGTGGHGVLDNVSIGTNTPSTIKGTRIDIDPDPNDDLSSDAINALTGIIDNTAIGSNIPRSGNFTGISTTSGVTGLNGTLGYGDVYDNSGSPVLVVDVSAKQFIGSATNVTQNAVKTVMGVIYPVGGIYISTLPANPAPTLNWPESQWERFAEGRTLLGFDTGTAISALSYRTATTDYLLTLANTSHGFLVGEDLQINVGGSTISQHGVSISVGHKATVKSVSGADVVVSLYGNPNPGSNVSFTIPNNSVAVHENFGTGEATGGATSQTLSTEHMADHIHDNVAWHGEQFFLMNDANTQTSLQGTRRAQGPTGGSDAHYYSYSGGVYGYETNSGVVQQEVGTPHYNMSPFVTTYMWKRTS